MSLDPYPTTEELDKIKKWKIQRDEHWGDLFEYIRSIYWQADWGLKVGRKYIYMSTGGWSGNEDIIYVMQENILMWSMYFYSMKRGGHYKFVKNKIK